MFGIDTDLIKVILMTLLLAGDKRTIDEAEGLLRKLYALYGVDWE